MLFLDWGFELNYSCVEGSEPRDRSKSKEKFCLCKEDFCNRGFPSTANIIVLCNVKILMIFLCTIFCCL